MNYKNTRPQTERIGSKIWAPNSVVINAPEERIACWLKGQRLYLTEDMRDMYELRNDTSSN